MLAGMQLTLWSFTDAAIRENRSAIADVRTDVSELAQRVASIDGFLEGRAGRRGSLKEPAVSSPAGEARSGPQGHSRRPVASTTETTANWGSYRAGSR